MSADIVHIRDFKRRAENESADVRLATRGAKRFAGGTLKRQ